MSSFYGAWRFSSIFAVSTVLGNFTLKTIAKSIAKHEKWNSYGKAVEIVQGQMKLTVLYVRNVIVKSPSHIARK